MKTIKPIKLPLLAILAALFFAGLSAFAAGFAYNDPAGGWTYTYGGGRTNGIGTPKAASALDGTWSGNNGSSEWDGSWRGVGNGLPGGISSDGDILTIEDIDLGSGTLNNRKVYFTHDLTQDAGVVNPGTILDTGITISFRARLPVSDPLAEVALPNGWGIFSDGKGNFNVHQYNGTVHSIIGFSLVRQSEPDNGFNFSAAGLTMNRLNGDSPAGGGAANSTGNAADNQIVPLDPTVFHEFWITIQANDATPGNGTHTVNVYVDGSTTPSTFNVTAATGNENTLNYLGIGLNNSGGAGCFDTDFFSYKQGVVVPTVLTPPAPPATITVLNGDTKVALNWSATLSTASYDVKRSVASGGAYTVITNTTARSFVDTAVVNGSTYYYVISSVNAAGGGPDSAEVVGKPDNTVTGLTATGGVARITLAWDAFSGAVGYTVRRSSVSGGPYSVVATGVASTSYVDSPLPSGTRYYYVVAASLAGGVESASSLEASAITAPAAPTLSVSLFAATVVRSSWTPVPGADLIELESSTDGANFVAVGVLGANQLSSTNGGFLPGTTYFLRVRSVNLGGRSLFSNVATITTPTFGVNVNFANAVNGQPANDPAPTPLGYVQDVGALFANQGNGLSYGWNRDITPDGRWRKTTIAPDLRYDTFMHLQKALPSAIWEIEIPNGFYLVRIVSDDTGGAVDATYQFDIEGVITESRPSVASQPAEFTNTCVVNDGRLTITSGPSAANNKIAFIDVYAAIPVAPAIGAQPQNVVIEENRTATFTVGLSGGSTPISFQWFRGADPVPGANRATLQLIHAQISDAGNYSVVVSNLAGTVTSDTVTLTVNPDVTPPRIVSAGSLGGSTINICFSEEMDNANAVLTDTFAYRINDSLVTYNSATLLADKRTVVLFLSAPISGQFTLVADTGFSDFLDLAGNKMLPSGAEVTGQLVSDFAGDVGGPGLAGSSYICDDTIQVIGGGSDIWNNSDQFQLVSRQIAGDFDAQVRVTSLAGANAITKAVLVARESTNADSRGYHISVNPVPPGRNQIELGFRDTTAGASATWGATFTPANIPNVWMRITRFGNTFTGYRSTDGLVWVPMGTNTPAVQYPLTMTVGIGVTAHDNTLLATGTFTNFKTTKIITVAGSISSDTFTGSFKTLPDTSYRVEFKENLDDPNWSLLTSITGDGAVQSFTDAVAANPRRFYRVIVP